MSYKVCSRCKVEKPVESFCKCTRMKDGLQPACKGCMNISYNQSRKKDQQRYQQVARNRQKRTLQKFKDWKSQQMCIVCGENDESCLDMHHIDPSQKEGSVSDMIWTRGWAKILEEINKCKVLCSNCHRKLHAGKINIGD